MKITKKEREILEDLFNIHEYENSIDLESWTDGGVDMFITIDKNSNTTLLEQLENFIEDFDIDEEIDMYRENEDYKNTFTISESLQDFEKWVDYINDIISNLIDTLDNDYNNEDEEEIEYKPLETLKGVGVKDTDNGLEIMLIGMTNGLLQKYEVVMNIKNFNESDLFDICYEISNEIKNLYYNNNGIPSMEEVKNIIRNIMVK